MTARAEWIERGRELAVLDVARALGIEVTPSRGTTSPGHFACVACGADRRHTKRRDPRGAAGILPGGKGWHCHQCDASGDALDLVRHVHGEGAREWVERFLVMPRADRPVRSGLHRPAQPTKSPATFPPAADVEALADACGPTADDEGVSAWLRSRGLDPVRVDALGGMVAALPDGAPCPPFAHVGKRPRAWSRADLRAVCPLYDSTGTPRSALARRIIPAADLPKSVSAQGFSRVGLVVANDVAVAMLRGTGEAPPHIVIAEGEVDALTWAHEHPTAAVFGIFAGAWTGDFARALPAGVPVLIATHHDPDGDRYAAKVIGTLTPRRRELGPVSRWSA